MSTQRLTAPCKVESMKRETKVLDGMTKDWELVVAAEGEVDGIPLGSIDGPPEGWTLMEGELDGMPEGWALALGSIEGELEGAVDGAFVRITNAARVGGPALGLIVGPPEGWTLVEGELVGIREGGALGSELGDALGPTLGSSLGSELGSATGLSEGEPLGDAHGVAHLRQKGPGGVAVMSGSRISMQLESIKRRSSSSGF
jgi:hypothetical protein